MAADYSEVNVDELMQKIREDVAKQRHTISLPENRSLKIDIALRLSYIESLLNAASSKSQPRIDFPSKLDRFPLNISKKPQKFLLRIYRFLFKEQRAVNLSLIQATRESLALSHELAEQVLALQVQLNQLQNHLITQERCSIASDPHAINKKSCFSDVDS